MRPFVFDYPACFICLIIQLRDIKVQGQNFTKAFKKSVLFSIFFFFFFFFADVVIRATGCRLVQFKWFRTLGSFRPL